MIEPGFQEFIGTLWATSKASFLQKVNTKVTLRVTAPPREVHEITETSRILRIFEEDEDIVVLLSHR